MSIKQVAYKPVAGEESCLSGKCRVIDCGFNYVPSVHLVEHFGPYWVENRCSFEQMRCDILSMRSLNSRFIRFHLMPANPERDNMPGIDSSKLKQDLKKSVVFARGLGLSVHMDIWSQDILNITEEEVRACVAEYIGLVSSYQIGNEAYFAWRSSPKYYEHVQRLIAAGKEMDPSSKWSIDIFANDLAYVRKSIPKLYEMLDMTMIHYYAMSDHRGWSPVYIEQLVHYCGGVNNRFEELKDERFIGIEWYLGEYGQFDKEIWLTETTGAGFHRYSGQMSEDVKAHNWEDVCTALAERTKVTRIGHHCFRDKMSWREFGTSHCGVVYVDGTPKPLARTFGEMAHRSLPDTDLTKWLNVSLSIDDQKLHVIIENTLDREMRGELSFDGIGSLTADRDPMKICIPARGRMRRDIPVNISAVHRHAVSQVFCLFRAEGWVSEYNTVVGWASLKREQPFTVDTDVEPLAGVRYVGGMETVARFFERFPNPSIITGGLIGFDAEMAYRLKSVIQARSGEVVKNVATINAAHVLDDPLIIIGNPDRNFYARMVESLASVDCRVSANNDCFVAVIAKPFDPQQWSSGVAFAIGYAYSPACIYVGGIDEGSIQRATYDLIRRLWLDKSVRVTDVLLGENPITGKSLAQFRVDMDPGPYRITAGLGGAGSAHETTLLINGEKVDAYSTNSSVRTFTHHREPKNGSIIIGFCSAQGKTWAVASLEIAHAGLLAEYRKFTFSGQTGEDEVSQETGLITPETKYSPARGYGWL